MRWYLENECLTPKGYPYNLLFIDPTKYKIVSDLSQQIWKAEIEVKILNNGNSNLIRLQNLL